MEFLKGSKSFTNHLKIFYFFEIRYSLLSRTRVKINWIKKSRCFAR